MKNKVINLFEKNKIIPNDSVKYSELLEKFISKFEKEFEDFEYLEDVIDFSINAWNAGNLKTILTEGESENVSNSLFENEEDLDAILLNKMIDYKVTKFKEYTNFIVNFELIETKGDPRLNVISQTEEDYLATAMDITDTEDFENNFEENFINRTAIIVKPLQPFIDWHNNLYPDSIIDALNVYDVNTYLINEDIDLDRWLKKKFDKLFKIELENWHTNKKEWPQKRNYKMFKQWFQIEISTMIYDLEKQPILKL